MKYEVRFTSQFKKDLKLSAKQGKDTDKLFSVVEKLANGETLEEKYRDHTLSGDYNAADGFFSNILYISAFLWYYICNKSAKGGGSYVT